MRHYSHSHSLHHLPWASKLVTSWFLFIMLAGFVVMLLLGAQTTGFTPAAASAHYLGGEDPSYAKSWHELLETAHFHLFSVPVVLLIVGHLVGLTRYPNAWKGGLITAAFVGFALNVATPFLIGKIAGPWPLLKLAGNALLGLALPASCILSLLDLHLPLRRMDNL